MTLRVREGRPDDRNDLRALLLAAFPTGMEADLVERLADDGDVVLELVAEQDGEIAGQVLFSAMNVTAGGAAVPAAGLAPVAVTAPFRRRGIADRLIREGLDQLRARGVAIVFVLGNPDYYGRFGFDRALAAPFASPYAGPYLMAAVLDTIPQGSGTADYAPAFAAFEEGE